MKLNDVAVRKAKPESKSYKMADGGGMYLEVMPNGSKYWWLKYRFGGKEKRLACGVYPDVPLSLVRSWRDDACKLLAQGIDPGANCKSQKTVKQGQEANSFEVIARRRSKPWWPALGFLFTRDYIIDLHMLSIS
ncbi:Arm DNA-binding domain-containing protein [Nitrosospira multiformis]|uniref:Integrase DNA-binding domain-containing protein n=1 Tax=Nitrosospira multiformis (strain ATCC 25196 / NCIMB 11849 / C 71) TaxID=323848 RepID=Q2YCS6_NITMU|nr:Arm DNA-binding domain-containing protein [Nitrosospira multiformis]ABB73445.1 hypothetical protein Nmul_A0136 [Nitrosospira multiformis ATCC 25196]SEA60958.1 protein of unknown function [Nitrosospira multiformis]SEG11600.1 protein of unknown function [Nitrosospira multiformis ATCC 25196]